MCTREPDGSQRLELRGELDLDAASTLRGPLLDQLHAPGPVTLDLRALNYQRPIHLQLITH